jgi:hypothetical protein
MNKILIALLVLTMIFSCEHLWDFSTIVVDSESKIAIDSAIAVFVTDGVDGGKYYSDSLGRIIIIGGAPGGINSKKNWEVRIEKVNYYSQIFDIDQQIDTVKLIKTK